MPPARPCCRAGRRWHAAPGGGGGAATQGTAPAVGAVAAQCMLVMELTQALPEWNNWLAYDVLFVRSVQGCLLWAQLQL